jgi:hypothetical protein
MRRVILLAALTLGGIGCTGKGRAEVDDHHPPEPQSSDHPAAPHPDYPVAAQTGADDIFLLEEPRRGPHVTGAVLPDRNQLKLSDAAYCEIQPGGAACSVVHAPAAASRPATPPVHFEVGRAGDRVAIVEEILPGGRAIHTYSFDYDAAGKLARVVALDVTGELEWARTFNPAGERYTERTLAGANALAGCGMLATRPDAAGRTREAACLQWNGKPMRDTNGVAVTQYKYDWQGFVAEEIRLGLDKKPVLGHDGVHRITYQRDAAGRVTAAMNFDLAGKPALSTADGCAGRKHEYDDRGLETKETCVGKDGQPARTDEGVAVTMLDANADGCPTGKHYLDRDGKPTHVRGVYGIRTTVDAACHEQSSTCLDAEDHPTACGPNEPAEYDYQVDDHGRIVSVKHRGADGDPGRDPDYDVFELRKDWDSLGNLVGQSCWGPSAEPVECDHTGYHAEKLNVDDAGRNREVRYFDTEGNPASNMGVAIRRYTYDNYDHIHEIDGFDTLGNVYEVLGMASQRRLYDAGHRLFGLLLLDRDGHPARYTGCFTGRDCPTRDWHAVRIFRGANGHVTRNEYFDADGQLIETLDCDVKRCWQ